MADARTQREVITQGQGGVPSADPESNRSPNTQAPGQQLIMIDHDQIVVYDHNPRLTDNDKFEDIKASIKARSLDQLLCVTQRPGESHYLLCAGGGTRYKAITQIIEETGDKHTYARYPVIVKPWVSEIDIMIAHATENGLRAPLNFFEQAMQEKTLRAQIICDDPAFEDASLRQRSARYDQLGYTVSPTYLSHFDYIFNWLYPAIKTALLAGMGHRTIAAIRAIESQTRTQFDTLKADTTNNFNTLYRSTLQSFGQSDDAFELDRFKHELEKQLARSIKTNPDTAQHQAPQKHIGKNATERLHSSSTNATASDLSQSHTDDRHKTASRQSSLSTCREQGEQIALSLAHDYGLLRGAFYAIPDVALGFGIENPDHSPWLTGDKDKDLDCVVVLLNLHAIFWTLKKTEIRSGRLTGDHPLLRAVSEQSDPSAVAASKTLQAIPPERRLCRLSELRVQSAIAQSRGRASAERSLVERLDAIRHHADQYAVALFTPP